MLPINLNRLETKKYEKHKKHYISIFENLDDYEEKTLEDVIEDEDLEISENIFYKLVEDTKESNPKKALCFFEKFIQNGIDAKLYIYMPVCNWQTII